MKNITRAIILCAVLLCTQSQAVHLSEDGTGQVLIFPYYTVNGGYDSLVKIINTTEQAKALRVRFREAANSREVFAFNLYLGPHDEWVGAVSKSGVGQNYFTRIITPDDSCTVPSIGNTGHLFTDSNYRHEMSDNYGPELNRMHEGFLEIIEMGEVTGNSAEQITINDNNSEYNCTAIENAWNSKNNGYWVMNTDTDMSIPTGGITGSVTLINVDRGTSMTQNPTALSNFSDEILHYSQDNDSPSLADGNTTSKVIDNDGNEYNLEWERGFQAVSSVLTKLSVSNEFVVSDGIGADTSFIVTMPTKNFHINEIYGNNYSLVFPFNYYTDGFTPASQLCSTFWYYLHSQEGQYPNLPPNPPAPTNPSSPFEFTPVICYATNSIVINNDINTSIHNGMLDSNFITYNTDFRSNGIGSYHTGIVTFANTESYFDSGWININFYYDNILTSSDDTEIILRGMPFIGFSTQQYVNGNLDGDNLANYAGIFNYKSDVVIEPHVSGDLVNQKMKLSQDNIGQVLLFPYYTVNNDIDSLISIVNTTDQAKALRIKFLEGKNSRECLNFSIYLGPYDVWTSALIATQASAAILGNHQGEPSAKIITADNSCTVPTSVSSVGQEFLPYDFDVVEGYDGLGRSLERCTEGHIEIIEMGIVTGTDAEYLSHGNNGIPDNCDAIQNNWIPGSPDAKWCDDECDKLGFQTPNGIGDPTINMLPPTGGLIGSLSLINVPAGMDSTYDAIAIENFSSEINHTLPSSKANNLSSGNNATTAIKTENGILHTTWNSPLDAVTALFMQSEVINDFVINPSIGAQNEWVNMYPTKQFYVDPFLSGSETVLPPFHQGLDSDRGACNNHRFIAYDQEQAINAQDIVIIPPVVPFPPEGESFYPRDCWSVNVVEVNSDENTNTILGSSLTISDLDIDLDYESVSNMPFTSGWMTRNFMEAYTPGQLQGVGENGDIHTIYGQPVLGFTVQTFINGTLMDENGQAVLANYASINMNKTKRIIEITTKNPQGKIK